MAKIGFSESIRQESDQLTMIIASIIEANQPTVNVAINSLCTLVTAVMHHFPEAEFESTLELFAKSVRIKRAALYKPSAKEMN